MTNVGSTIEQCAVYPANTGVKTILQVGKTMYARSGIVASCEWGAGGATQYFTGKSIQALIELGFLL